MQIPSPGQSCYDNHWIIPSEVKRRESCFQQIRIQISIWISCVILSFWSIENALCTCIILVPCIRKYTCRRTFSRFILFITQTIEMRLKEIWNVLLYHMNFLKWWMLIDRISLTDVVSLCSQEIAWPSYSDDRITHLSNEYIKLNVLFSCSRWRGHFGVPVSA